MELYCRICHDYVDSIGTHDQFGFIQEIRALRIQRRYSLRGCQWWLRESRWQSIFFLNWLTKAEQSQDLDSLKEIIYPITELTDDVCLQCLKTLQQTKIDQRLAYSDERHKLGLCLMKYCSNSLGNKEHSIDGEDDKDYYCTSHQKDLETIGKEPKLQFPDKLDRIK